ncbi:hypothetical protein Bbelb_114530 [Branchiostoma belcheri]|nr:hypothetical protein Bbelb_114530 [Branchiostoma belcheri]
MEDIMEAFDIKDLTIPQVGGSQAMKGRDSNVSSGSTHSPAMDGIGPSQTTSLPYMSTDLPTASHDWYQPASGVCSDTEQFGQAHPWFSKNTTRKTISDVNVFKRFCSAPPFNEPRPPEEIPPSQLCPLLISYFTSCKKNNGQNYEPESLNSMLRSMERYLKASGYMYSVVQSEEFRELRLSIKRRKDELKELSHVKNSTETVSKRNFPTDEEEMVLYSKGVIGLTNPFSLLCAMWIINSKYFRIKSRETTVSLRWGEIQLKKLANGNEYLEYASLTTDNPVARKAWAVVQGNLPCPVVVYKQYALHRPDAMMHPDAPFYLGYWRKLPSNKVWFREQGLGKESILRMKSLLKEQAQNMNLPVPVLIHPDMTSDTTSDMTSDMTPTMTPTMTPALPEGPSTSTAMAPTTPTTRHPSPPTMVPTPTTLCYTPNLSCYPLPLPCHPPVPVWVPPFRHPQRPPFRSPPLCSIPRPDVSPSAVLTRVSHHGRLHVSHLQDVKLAEQVTPQSCQHQYYMRFLYTILPLETRTPINMPNKVELHEKLQVLQAEKMELRENVQVLQAEKMELREKVQVLHQEKVQLQQSVELREKVQVLLEEKVQLQLSVDLREQLQVLHQGKVQLQLSVELHEQLQVLQQEKVQLQQSVELREKVQVLQEEKVQLQQSVLVLERDKAVLQAKLAQMKLALREMEMQPVGESNKVGDATQTFMLEMQKNLISQFQENIIRLQKDFLEEKRKAVEETKRKQWCIQCGKEARLYCCWNTSYCDFSCQQAHWPVHMSTCHQQTNQQPAPAAPQPMDEERSLVPRSSEKTLVPRPFLQQPVIIPAKAEPDSSSQLMAAGGSVSRLGQVAAGRGPPRCVDMHEREEGGGNNDSPSPTSQNQTGNSTQRRKNDHSYSHK